MTTFTKTCDQCPAQISWNNEKKQFEDTLFPGERHNHQKFKDAAAQQEEHSAEHKPATEKPKDGGRECYTCKGNGHPNVKIYFNSAKVSTSGKPIPLDNPNQVNGQWKTHEHRKKGQSAEQAQEQQDFLEANQPPEVEPGQEYSDDEMRALIGEFLNNSGELIAKLADIAPKLETIVGYLLNKAVSRASDK